ncbi:cyclin [Zalerion maritima]|uniref:Cyclin n=1 Tax=Zalerion maritima TaxID=339359 RepID=A0AAD5RYT4_9PEZI|nr:cyclin [Zalerion maritima]
MSLVSYRSYPAFPPSPAQTSGSRVRHTVSSPIGQLKLLPYPYPTARDQAPASLPPTGGLRTPPADDIMSSTVYHGPTAGPTCVSEPYGSSSYSADAQRSKMQQSTEYFRYPQSSQSQPPVCSATNSQPHLQAQHLPHPQPQLQLPQPHALSRTQNAPAISLPSSAATLASVNTSSACSSFQSHGITQTGSKQSTRPSTPKSSSYSDVCGARRDSTCVAYQGLQVPNRISPRGGGLSEFAAQTCCFVWFETFDVLVSIDNALEGRRPIPPLTRLAVPAPGYKKWVNSIISTTQVSQNVVLLALLFIHRLKHATRTVLPQPGSEYRLLTVALMLGNKFLDDNTYTNKTWAEVSGMTVQEIHVMEVEFLSNMRYNLYATAKDWEKWLDELKGIFEYCERAQPRQPSPTSIPSPHRSFRRSPIPSPTGSCYSATSSRQPAMASNWSFPGGSPLSTRPIFDGALTRKRSFEGDPTEPPAKRLTRLPQAAHNAAATNTSDTTPVTLPSTYGIPSSSVLAMAPAVGSQTSHHETIRLPTPALSLNTQVGPAPKSQPSAASYAPQPTISLPPLNQGIRAMSTVYSSTAATVPSTTAYASQVTGVVATATGSTSLPAYAPGYHTPTKKLSPTNTLHPPFASSPLTDGFQSGVHTPISSSPSIYLQQRSSPYRPIRHVNTLLYPPPSASLHEYHLTPSQMHYQPLGRRNDVRTGIVPDYRGARNYPAPVPSSGNRAPLLHPTLS